MTERTTLSRCIEPADCQSPSLAGRCGSSVVPNAILFLFTLAVLLLISCLNSSAQSITGLSQNLFVADYAHQRIVEFATGGTSTTFSTSVSYPTMLAFDRAGNLYCSSEVYGNIYKFANTDGVLSSSPTIFASGLRVPEGLAFDDDGDLFVVSFGSASIVRITPDGTQTTFASGLRRPIGIAIDTSQNVYVSDQGADSIYKYTPDGAQSTFATGIPGPVGITFTRAGNLLVADEPSGNVFQITPGGEKTTFVSGLGYNIVDVKEDDMGNVFVSSRQYAAIYEVNAGSPIKFSTGFSVFGMAFQPVPEPATWSLLALGAVVLLGGRLLRRLSCLAVFLLSIASASADVLLTFDPPDFFSGSHQLDSYTESGIIFTGTFSGSFSQTRYVPECPDNGTAHLDIGRFYTQFKFQNDALFRINRLDLAEYSTAFAFPQTIEFRGIKADNSFVTFSFTTDGMIDGMGPLVDFQTVMFPTTFANLQRVEFNSAGFSIDNVSLSIVPEPTTWSLLALSRSSAVCECVAARPEPLKMRKT